jgi:hypothetical protein
MHQNKKQSNYRGRERKGARASMYAKVTSQRKGTARQKARARARAEA